MKRLKKLGRNMIGQSKAFLKMLIDRWLTLLCRDYRPELEKQAKEKVSPPNTPH